MNDHADRADWVFTNRDGDKSGGVLILDSRRLHCYEQDGTLAWSRSFKTRREARASFDGDLRAMRKNPCYTFGVAA